MKIFILLLFVSLQALAQPSLKKCELDIQKLCQKKTPQENIQCLINNRQELTDLCREELNRISAIMKSTGSRGSGGLSSFSGVTGGMGLLPPQKRVINYTGTYASENNPTTVEQHRLNIASPVWSHDKESFAMSLNSSRLEWAEPQEWKDKENQGRTPKGLTRLELGGQYAKRLENSRMLGVRTSVGSASDKPFYSKKELTFSLNATYAKPAKNEKDYWIFTVFMSNNNPLLNFLPIPGFIYLKKTDTFTGMFGLPFLSIQWTPTRPLLFSMSYFITNFNSEISWSLTDYLQIFSGFAISQQTFLREDRSLHTDRLFFNEKKVYLGLRIPFGGAFSGDIQVGESFDRKLAEGRRFNDTKMSADFGRSWYQSINLNMMF